MSEDTSPFPVRIVINTETDLKYVFERTGEDSWAFRTEDDLITVKMGERHTGKVMAKIIESVIEGDSQGEVDRADEMSRLTQKAIRMQPKGPEWSDIPLRREE